MKTLLVLAAALAAGAAAHAQPAVDQGQDWANTASDVPAPAAVGGPYEPVEAHSEMTADVDTTETAIGGPIEERTGYPACSRTVTDSCIQLHERGVTGAGN